MLSVAPENSQTRAGVGASLVSRSPVELDLAAGSGLVGVAGFVDLGVVGSADHGAAFDGGSAAGAPGVEVVEVRFGGAAVAVIDDAGAVADGDGEALGFR